MKLVLEGWRDPTTNWKTWVELLHSSHQFTWRKAGIYDSIMASTYQIPRNKDLLLVLAEKWCCETKSFVFPWGEATITLEDIELLSGYSILGQPFCTPLKTRDLVDIEENLITARKELIKSRSKKACQNAWMKKFMDSDSEIEHEAFLSLWLSRYVFSSNARGMIRSIVFPIAIHLSRGTKLALASPVLASLYKDIGLLKGDIAAVPNFQIEGNNKDNDTPITLWSPLQLVQLWAWERFPIIQPTPNLLKHGEPKSAKWHRVKSIRGKLLRSLLDSVGETFQRNASPTIVKDSCFSNADSKEVHFAQSVRACELTGVDSVEKYLPNREKSQSVNGSTPPGFTPQRDRSKAGNSDEEDQLTLSEAPDRTLKRKYVRYDESEAESLSSPDNEAAGKEPVMEKTAENILPSNASDSGEDKYVEDTIAVSVSGLEDRISKLEKMFAILKGEPENGLK